MIKFVIDLRQVCGLLCVIWFPLPNKTDRHDIAEILLKGVLSTINQPTFDVGGLIRGGLYLATLLIFSRHYMCLIDTYFIANSLFLLTELFDWQTFLSCNRVVFSTYKGVK